MPKMLTYLELKFQIRYEGIFSYWCICIDYCRIGVIQCVIILVPILLTNLHCTLNKIDHQSP
jgi:hypothetical protein